MWMPNTIRNINMVFMNVTRHAGVVEAAPLSRKAIIYYFLFV
jgi:hypothetical protein